MKTAGMNQTRQKILQYIRDFVDDKGYAPTIRDILKGCSISSTAVVQHHLNMLEKEGIIHRDPEIFRSIQLMDKTNIVRVPLLGTIAAGEPIPVPGSDSWNTEPLETIELTDEFVDKDDIFALRVKGLSMIDALIDDGDLVLMQPTKSANNGDMVAVWLKDKEEVTLKKYYHERERVRLQPANSQMKPIYCAPENVEIQGKVVGVIRKLS
jgi:repressor LexA